MHSQEATNKPMPQSENLGIVSFENFVYKNTLLLSERGTQT